MSETGKMKTKENTRDITKIAIKAKEAKTINIYISIIMERVVLVEVGVDYQLACVSDKVSVPELPSRPGYLPQPEFTQIVCLFVCLD